MDPDLAWKPWGLEAASSGASLLPAKAAMVAWALAPVASRTGWARARMKSVGQGASAMCRPIDEQASVRSRLSSTRMDALRDICTIVIPNQKTTTRTPRESHMQELVSTPDKLALLAVVLDIV
jgi:hypothetical protein